MRNSSKGMVSIDLETLGLNNNAVILSVGICVTEWKPQTIEQLKERSINIKLSTRDQITKYGMTLDEEVCDFWREQGPEATSILTPSASDLLLEELPEAIDRFMDSQGVKWREYDTYDRRCFDVSKLQWVYEDALKKGHGNVPWDFRNLYEFGTALAYLGADRYGGIKDCPDGLIYHNSQDDAVLDAYRLLINLEQVGLLTK